LRQQKELKLTNYCLRHHFKEGCKPTNIEVKIIGTSNFNSGHLSHCFSFMTTKIIDL